MDDKLKELTQKLYEEGLSKGRSEAENLIDRTKKEAAEIIAAAESKAAGIIASAQAAAEDLSKQTQTDIAIASQRMIATLKQQIENLILTRSITPAITDAIADTSFIKELILTIIKNWNGNDMRVVLPESTSAELVRELEASAHATMSGGAAINMAEGVKSGFKIGPRDGSYYISFNDADFDTLFKEFLKPRVADLLYK